MASTSRLFYNSSLWNWWRYSLPYPVPETYSLPTGYRWKSYTDWKKLVYNRTCLQLPHKRIGFVVNGKQGQELIQHIAVLTCVVYAVVGPDKIIKLLCMLSSDDQINKIIGSPAVLYKLERCVAGGHHDIMRTHRIFILVLYKRHMRERIQKQVVGVIVGISLVNLWSFV